MSKSNSFIRGAAILSIAGILVKILGAIYRIPLANIIKDEGMGYYQTAYPLYILLLSISTSGFPIAIAKLVSEKRALGDYRGAFKSFRLALMGLALGGLMSSLYVLIKGKEIVRAMENTRAYYSLIALVPALFLVPIMSAFRGFFQGQMRMFPTALSQIIEQGGRLVFGLGLTYYLLGYGIPQAAGGASFGGSAGALLATISILIIYFRERKDIASELMTTSHVGESSNGEIIMELLKIAIPITLGASIIPIMDTIDASLIIRRLEAIDYSKVVANELYGRLKGFAQTLVNMPQVFSLAIGSSLLPLLAEANTRKNKEELKSIVNGGLRLTLLIGLPASIGLYILSEPIINLLYYNNSFETIHSTSVILSYLSFGVIFLTLIQTSTAILQGLGKAYIPVINLSLGAICKLVLTYSLITRPNLNINGAAIATVVAFAMTSCLNILYLDRKLKLRIDYRLILLKPLLASLMMGLGVKYSYLGLENILGSRLSTILSIILGGGFYLVFLLITSTISPRDMIRLPNKGSLGSMAKD